MSIEIVDADAIERELSPAARAESVVDSRQDRGETGDRGEETAAGGSAKRLIDIDARLDRSLTHLAQQIDKLHSLNARLFGAGRATSENQKDNGNGSSGVIPSLDGKNAKFDALLEKLDAEVQAIDTLA